MLANKAFGFDPEREARVWPFEARFHTANGIQLHYVDEGAGDPILFVHGNPTWAFVWRAFIDRLMGRHRCVAPDHMGFGKSDTPVDPEKYSLASHITNLKALVHALDLRDITLVMQDWGGPIGFGMAVDEPERIKRLVILNTWAFVYDEDTPMHPLLERFREPGLGQALVQGLNLFVEGYLPQGIHHKERLADIMPFYRAPFPDYASRIGTLRFPQDIPAGEAHPATPVMRHIEENLTALQVPTTIIWGDRDPDFTPDVADQWQAVYPHAERHHIATASHFLQEDEPEMILSLIEGFLARNP